MPPIAILTYFFAHRVFPISREVQRKKGHLTEASDEAVVGIEMVQAFGREDDVRDRFADRAEAVRHETMRQASVEARFLPGLIFLPTLGIAAVLLVGGREAIAGNLTIGEFTLFMTLLLQLVWPLEALGWIINLGQRATAPRRAASPGSTGSSRCPSRPSRRRSPRGRSPCASRTSTSATRRQPRCSRGVDLEVSRANRRGLRPDRRREDVAPQPAPAVLRPHGRARARRRRRRARRRARGAAAAVAIVTQKPVLFSIPLRENLLAARPTRTGARSSTRARRPASPTS